MDKSKELNLIAQRIRALAQNGITYSLSEYDTERYDELMELSNRIVSLVTDYDIKVIHSQYSLTQEYATPKIDVRSVVFNSKDEILLVKEKADKRWSLPGGWADIGFSPGEIAVKEVKEEVGLDVKPVRLLALMDMKCHPHPPLPFYVYKVFILCEITGGEFTEAFDILDKDFFRVNNLPSLSRERIVPEQIRLMFDYYKNPQKEAYFD
jgi:ADP-ribose pyrophosphatase YjhB (NUDIX family)